MNLSLNIRSVLWKKNKTKPLFSTKLRVGDEVFVTSGKNRGVVKKEGFRGKIESFSKKKNRVFVSGANIVKRHTRASSQNDAGGILDKSMPVAISNVMLVDPKLSVPTRIGYKIEDGKKVRFAKKSGSLL